MRLALIVVLGCAGAALASPCASQPSEAQRKASEAQAAWDREHHCEAGFTPIADVAATGANLRRARFTEGRLALRMPGVTLEQLRDGRVFVSLTGGATRGELRTELSPSAWADMQALEAAAFTRPPPPVVDPKSPPGPPPICHGWGVTLEAAQSGASRKATAAGCFYRQTKAAYDYSAALARLALNNIPECAAAREKTTSDDPFYGLAACRGRFEPKTTDWRC